MHLHGARAAVEAAEQARQHAGVIEHAREVSRIGNVIAKSIHRSGTSSITGERGKREPEEGGTHRERRAARHSTEVTAVR